MREFKQQFPHYCGVDLHAKTMHVHVVNKKGATVVDRNIECDPDAFLQLIKPYRKSMVVGCECMFSWYWLADLCEAKSIAFVLGHALYMKSIHAGKKKSDRIDAGKIAGMLRGGRFPLAFVYPKGRRETRDLLRRRCKYVRMRSHLLTHIAIVNARYNLPPLPKAVASLKNRSAVLDRFEHPSVRQSIASDLRIIDHLNVEIETMESHILAEARSEDQGILDRLRTIPGVGKVLAMVILYEMGEIVRFPEVGNFLSYARLVRCEHESAGRTTGYGNKRIGNAYLKWAFGQVSCQMMRYVPAIKSMVERKAKKKGKRKAMAVLEAKIGRTVYGMWSKGMDFDGAKFLRGDGPTT